jgi:hypothetical protein
MAANLLVLAVLDVVMLRRRATSPLLLVALDDPIERVLSVGRS